MIFFLLLLAVAGALSVATIILLLNDGRGYLRCPPASHVEDTRFRAPGAVL